MEGGGREIERLGPLNLEEFLSFAKSFGEALNGGELVLLKGELGSGKTTFVRGMAEGLGIDPKIVRSPTFTLMNVYPGRVVLYHVDLYRIDDTEQLYYIGIEEFLEERDGVMAVEWADLFESFWDGGIWVEIKALDDGRREITVRDEEGILGGAIEIWKERARQVREG